MALATLAVGWALPAASQVANGSFEMGVDPGAFVNLAGGSTAIDDWTVTGDGIDYIGTAWVSSDGARGLDLDGSVGSPFPSGGVAQSFATTIGATYQVAFDMAGNPQSAPVVKPMRVSAAGQSAELFFDTTGRTLMDMGWETMTFEFTATDKTTLLEFRSLTQEMGLPTGWGPALDNVVVTELVPAVPALGAWGRAAWLGLVLAIGVAAHATRRRVPAA